jgi:2-polyprenyl-3-methyl-5-hydroxy-6-metoxy-1,4-benzoquinol methylase
MRQMSARGPHEAPPPPAARVGSALASDFVLILCDNPGQGCGRLMAMDDVDLAAYFQVNPEILRFVPELLQDLDALGSDPKLVVAWLDESGLRGPKIRVLDLGCGKGAVAVAVADRLGCRVRGVDALPAFLEAARRQALARGVGALCTFEAGDLRDTVAKGGDYDAVMLVSVGVLGSPEAMVRGCRACTRPGGVMILEEAYLREAGRLEFAGYGDVVTRAETLRQLTSWGDELIAERRTPLAEMQAQNRRFNESIERRAAELAARHPEHAPAFRAYVEKEHRECELLESALECATWMLRRA